MDFSLSEDMKMVQALARDFVKDQLMPLERDILGREVDLEGASRQLSPEKEERLVKIAKDTGLWGLSLPEELGGAGLGILAACLVEEELAKSIVPFQMGDVTPILFDCNEEQRQDYLLPVIERRKTGLMALLEPGEGADLAYLKTKARKVNGSYYLDGTKIALSGNGKLDFALVFAVTDSEKSFRGGVTCFLVDKGASGFNIIRGEGDSGWKAQVAAPVILNFENCTVPADKILGAEGQAFRLGNKWLLPRRILRSARCIGAAVRLLDTAVEHAKSWQSYGQSISGWPSIRRILCEMAVDIQSARLMVYQAACKADEGQDVRQEAAMAKVMATEMLDRTANRAVLVKGGPGPATELPLEILCRSMQVRHVRERSLELQKEAITNHLLNLGRIL
jgi:acyl-CoA dehydrogenase